MAPAACVRPCVRPCVRASVRACVRAYASSLASIVIVPGGAILPRHVFTCRDAHLGCISVQAAREDKGRVAAARCDAACRDANAAARSLKAVGIAEACPSVRADDGGPSMIGKCFTFLKPDSSERSRVPHSCFYACTLDLLTGRGS
ncbi:uncharacterized protein LOC105423924 [Pogonomyrmex barbatus]|uniref:Uncharacterized protein LOC105423924 n=1 Tax=Pogonomyrmex barbatus TaxID=144034 RepID=A0A6I9WKG3_9HYME|nr:uncharacterized protein LOC105423924 [Pogonomyrmex barbatus]